MRAHGRIVFQSSRETAWQSRIEAYNLMFEGGPAAGEAATWEIPDHILYALTVFKLNPAEGKERRFHDFTRAILANDAI
jgi:hypothetical protein